MRLASSQSSLCSLSWDKLVAVSDRDPISSLTQETVHPRLENISSRHCRIFSFVKEQTLEEIFSPMP